MNKESPWLFPSTRAGQHISRSALRNRLKIFDLQPLATRNTTLFDLSKELDPASLAAFLGYTNATMTKHSAHVGM